ncbi:MAG: hypothetical protein SH850_10615 [Planctomycetaceae bacterium]|nr:hypothetical protein [Planctomycetaceae bacterium]
MKKPPVEFKQSLKPFDDLLTTLVAVPKAEVESAEKAERAKKLRAAAKKKPKRDH